MIDFNAAEIVVLAVLAVIIFGPEKLPELARKAARVVNYLRGIANDARGQLREQLGPEFDDIHLSDLDPRSIGRQILGPETARELGEVGRTAAGAAAAADAAVRSRPERGTADASVPEAPSAGSGDLPEAEQTLMVPLARVVAYDPEAT